MPALRPRAVHRIVIAALIAGMALTSCGQPPAAPPVPNPPGETPPAPPPNGPLPPPAEPEEAPTSPSGVPVGSVVALPPGAPEGAVVDAGSGVLAVALRAPDRLALIDIATRRVRAVPTPGAARHLVQGAPGELLLLAENTNVLARVSLPTGQVLERTGVGAQPHDAVQVGGTTFVTNELGGSVGIVQDGRMVRELGGLAQPGGITAADGRVAAVDVRGNQLHVFDAATSQELAVLPAGQGPSHARPIGRGRIAVADTRGNAVLTFDLSGEPRQLNTLPLPGRAYGLATDQERGWVYATLANTNQLAALKVRPDGTLAARKTLPTVPQPNDVAVEPRTGTVFVVGAAQSQVQVIPPETFGG